MACSCGNLNRIDLSDYSTYTVQAKEITAATHDSCEYNGSAFIGLTSGSGSCVVARLEVTAQQDNLWQMLHTVARQPFYVRSDFLRMPFSC